MPVKIPSETILKLTKALRKARSLKVVPKAFWFIVIGLGMADVDGVLLGVVVVVVVVVVAVAVVAVGAGLAGVLIKDWMVPDTGLKISTRFLFTGRPCVLSPLRTLPFSFNHSSFQDYFLIEQFIRFYIHNDAWEMWNLVEVEFKVDFRKILLSRVVLQLYLT